MDNNQQVATQAAAKPVVDNVTLSHTEVTPSVSDLGLNEAKVMRGPSVQSPLSGQDVSMTVGQPYGGPIVGTEVEPNVRNETNPYDQQSV